jgi:hypothetical protein
MAIVTIRDETSLGETSGELTLEFLTERVTAREIIRSRVYQEVTEFNARQFSRFRGLVQPRDTTEAAGGYEMKQPRRIDWQEQFDTAVRAFERNGFLLIVDDKQVTDLDVELVLKHDTSVSFLRLVPLIGG